MVTNEFFYRCTDEYCILLFLQNTLMLFRREDGEYGGNDFRASSQSVLTSLVQAESAECVGNRLNDLYGINITACASYMQTDLDDGFEFSFDNVIQNLW